MSVLETPRILFRGNMSWDPIVTNNNSPVYNEDSAENIYPDAPTIQAQVAAFRQEAIDDVDPTVNLPNGPNRVWNPQGTHRSSFYDEDSPDAAAPDSQIIQSCVSAVDTGGGASTDDPLVGTPVNFTGMLVDLEPYGSYSSQLFFDTMSFGIAGGPSIFANRSSRVTDRYINLGRNPVYYIAGFASVMWQTSFATEDLVINAFDSTVLQDLQTALAEPGVLGLTVRWTVYRTIYYNTPALATDIDLRTTVARDLMGKLNGGGFQPNPARSKLVGVIGLWREGEPAHEPGDRALLATQWPPGRPATPPCVATAFARLTDSSITIDLESSMPETGLDLTKQDWGDLQVRAVDPDNPANVVATLGEPIAYAQYNREAYEAGSGIVTIPVDATDAANALDANIQVVQVSSGTVLLDEAPLRALPLVPNLYVDEGDDSTGVFQVYVRGVPTAESGIPFSLSTLDYSGSTIQSTVQIETDGNGQLSFPIDTSAGAVASYVPVPGAMPNPDLPTNGINTQINTYMYARTLPADTAVGQLPATFDNVYANVLANWNAMAPCMDNWLNLADEGQVLAYGPAIKGLTDPAAFENYRFMPVTRDMTAGERTLLYNFLDGVVVQPSVAQGAQATLAVAAPAPQAEEPAPATSGLAKMSQDMR